ncbi:MAG: amino acid permease [Spirochaetaceae bacterium]|nr:MAG: amino acid permease [Spirochaetaceae bacterium]
MKLPRFLRPLASWPQRAAPQSAVTAEFAYPDSDDAGAGRVRTLGTFGGVFTPSFLTIIGVIMYLRFSWVLANAGLLRTIVIVLIANSITFVSSLSVASIASNEQMETGGAYFMVSRVLGYQAGGGIGIPLFFSQALSIALYVIGFAEAFTAVYPQWSITPVAIITMLVLVVAGIAGARFMVVLQYLILLVILASFVSIGAGFQPLHLVSNLEPAYREGLAFWGVFAVFFPAVTGILAGVSMSGDLKTPARSIPRGTFLAVGAGFLVYILVPVMLAFSVDRQGLWASTALRDASRWPLLVTFGVIGATLSSAIGSLMAAPRTLQALGIDGIVPPFLGRGVGRTSEPLLAMALSITLALGAILLGSLNQVAEVLTMFFLTTYGVLNLSAGMEKLVDNPSFRPTVSVPWWISFLGALGCGAVMFLINVVATLVAIAAVLLIFVWLRIRPVREELARSIPRDQGGLWEGFWTALFFRVSRRLAESRTGSGKNWRPFIQVFASEIDAHGELMTTAALLTRQGGALATYAMLNRSPSTRLLGERERVSRELATFVGEFSQPNVFTRVVETGDFHEGVIVAAQAAAFAAGEYNTVMLGLPGNPRVDRDYTRLLTHLSAIRRNVLLLKRGSPLWTSIAGPIIVWWGGQENNVRLMLILAYLLRTSTGTFHGLDHPIHLKTVVSDPAKAPEVRRRLMESLKELRVTAEAQVIVNTEEHSIPEVLARESAGAALVIVGMAKPEEATLKTYLPGLRTIAGGLGTTLMVMSNIPDIRYI